jgi:hypothetical protein
MRLPNAFVVATANVLEADAMITGNANRKQRSTRVRVVA